MMKIRIPVDHDFDFYACRKMYREYQKEVGDYSSFNQLIKNTFFYAFYDDETLVGCIYLFQIKNKKFNTSKMFMNGFAKRGYHIFNLQAVKKILSWFKTDIYAKSNKKTAIYLLLKLGFKKISDNLFVYYYNQDSFFEES